MTDISHAAKVKACELANADDRPAGWEPSDIYEGGAPLMVTFARFVEQVSDAAKSIRPVLDSLDIGGLPTVGHAIARVNSLILPDPVEDTDWDEEMLGALQRAASLGFNNREATAYFISTLKRGLKGADSE
jgi:hypothetical protein